MYVMAFNPNATQLGFSRKCEGYIFPAKKCSLTNNSAPYFGQSMLILHQIFQWVSIPEIFTREFQNFVRAHLHLLKNRSRSVIQFNANVCAKTFFPLCNKFFRCYNEKSLNLLRSPSDCLCSYLICTFVKVCVAVFYYSHKSWLLNHEPNYIYVTGTLCKCEWFKCSWLVSMQRMENQSTFKALNTESIPLYSAPCELHMKSSRCSSAGSQKESGRCIIWGE